ncbi:hypothetical protein IAR50_000591 [Cryptococcus sp. DSM 104548]
MANDVARRSAYARLVSSLTATTGSSQSRTVVKRTSAESTSSWSTAKSTSSWSTAPSVNIVSPRLVSHIRTLRFGKLIGRGALWDVYELPDAPGYVAKFCRPYGTLFHSGYEHLRVGDIVRELETDTMISQILAPSGHAPVTHGHGRGSWVNKADVIYDKDGNENGWLIDVALETRNEIVEWLKTVHQIGYTNGNLSPRHLFVAKDGDEWKIIDWGKACDRSVDEEDRWRRQLENEICDLDLFF